MKTDPTDTGGLFVSRRPGTRPIRYRTQPRVDGATESTFLGIIVAFLGLLFTLILGLMVLRRLDLAWILVRRAGGHDQRGGMVVRVFAVPAVVGPTLFFSWLFFIGGLTPQLAPST